VHYCFPVWREKIYMEHGVDAPLRGKFQPIIYGRHHLDDFKRSMSSGRKLGGRLIDPEILAVQPYLVPFFVLGRISVFDP
jgi:hypothetical protein